MRLSQQSFTTVSNVVYTIYNFMELKYIDIHSHLNSPKFENDLDLVLERMKESGVGTIVIGVDKDTSKKAVELADKYENIWACVGVHPTDSEEGFDEGFFGELAKNKNVVAIGECGLDYFRKTTREEKKRQKKLFEQQIDFAVVNELPLMLHVRSAHKDVLEILREKKKEHGNKLRGNSHFFSESLEVAQRYFELGFTISLTGIVTYSDEFDELIKNSSLEMLHIETDSPCAAPESHRGKRNEPSYVVEIAKKIAQIKGEDNGMIRKKLLENAQNLFKIRLK